jgi:hypothetical protein
MRTWHTAFIHWVEHVAGVIINNYWMRSSRVWGIIKAEVCVISRRLRQITQTQALIIPHILREPNSIIALLFICRNTQNKLTWRHSVLHCFSIYHEITSNVVYLFSINIPLWCHNSKFGQIWADMTISPTALSQLKLLNYFQ